jgi:hypothetical protein
MFGQRHDYIRKRLKNRAQHYFPFFLFTLLATAGLRLTEFVMLGITRGFSLPNWAARAAIWLS